MRSHTVDPHQVAARRCSDCRTLCYVDAITWARQGARCTDCQHRRRRYVQAVLHRPEA